MPRTALEVALPKIKQSSAKTKLGNLNPKGEDNTLMWFLVLEASKLKCLIKGSIHRIKCKEIMVTCLIPLEG